MGVVLADRIHMLVLSMLDLHMHLEVPLRREKAKSLCQMIVSLKAIGDLFHMKGSSLVRSLPHIINIIQSDIEQLIISLKTKLQNEIAKGSQAVKTGFLSSLIRGGTDTETRLIDSLSLVIHLGTITHIDKHANFVESVMLLVCLHGMRIAANAEM